MDALLNRLGVEILAIEQPCLERIEMLPFHHRDPFDRLIIAQSLVESVAVLTSDAQFAQYGVTVVDARV